MINLDDLKQIKQLDKSHVLGSVEALPLQCQHAWEEANKVVVPNDYQNIDALVMTGMGGSGLGARLTESIYGPDLRVPLVRVNDYGLPGFVNEQTLVVCSSYSGSTEETISNAQQAINRKAKWLAVATGGQLLAMARQAGVPYYQIQPTYNPSNQPRMAIGYSVISQLVLAHKCGVINLSEKELVAAIETMRQLQKNLKVEVPQAQNPAKQLAKKVYHKILVYVAGCHLTGAMHTIKNQLNENAKTFAAGFDIPELNHHLMEGLKHPLTNQQDLFFFIAQSDLYPERIKKRVVLTQDVVQQQGIETFLWQPQSQSKLSQAFELIQFGAYVNFYLSMLYGIDPAPIPWVDYFKKKLK